MTNPTTTYLNLGGYLRQLREQVACTQADLARLVAGKYGPGTGVHQCIVSRWELGVSCPTAAQLDLLLRALGATIKQRNDALRHAGDCLLPVENYDDIVF